MSEIDAAKESMNKALKALEHEFLNLRTGRPSAGLLEGITVEYYGVPTPITQVAAIKVPEAHLMTIEPWDKGIVNAVNQAIAYFDQVTAVQKDDTAWQTKGESGT